VLKEKEMFAYFAELQINQTNYGKKKFHYSFILWVVLAFLFSVLAYPFFCFDLETNKSLLKISVLCLELGLGFYGYKLALKTVLPYEAFKKYVPKYKLGGLLRYNYIMSVSLAIGFVPVFMDKMLKTSCSSWFEKPSSLVLFVVLPFAAADVSYLVTMYFKNRHEKKPGL